MPGANATFLSGDYTAALKAFSELLAQAPDDGQLLVNRAAAHFGSSMRRGATERADALSPFQNAELELYRKAITDCDKAVELDRFNLRAYCIKGAPVSACHRACLLRSAHAAAWSPAPPAPPRQVQRTRH
jgi:tetratricopeptide (TPR) repeat protein